MLDRIHFIKGNHINTTALALQALANEGETSGDDEKAAVAYFGTIANKFSNRCKHDDV